MAKFLTDLVVKSQGKNWVTEEELGYITNLFDDPWYIHIPKGYETDFASIPRIFWTIIGHPYGSYRRAAVLHDYLYQCGLFSRHVADAIFLEAMKVEGVWWHKRHIIHKAVRLGGWLAWRNHRKTHAGT